MISDTDLAYAAAIIDGEGSISCVITNERSRSLCIQVSVGMIDHEIPLWLAENFGGSTHRARRVKKHHRQLLRWTVSTQKSAAFLRQILPYLRAKKSQALTALEIVNLQLPSGGDRYAGHVRKSEETWFLQLALKSRLSEQNARGSSG